MFKVMIVDNESAIRKGLIHCIRWDTLDCMIIAQAEDGVDALEQVPKVRPDIVISDIRMPEMDGLALAQNLHIQYPHIKVIILTGFPDFEYAQKSITYQVVDFVLKPTSVDSLTQAIEKAKERIAEEGLGQKLRMELAYKEKQNLILQRLMLLHDLIRGIDISQLYLLNRMAQLKLNLNSYFVLRMDIAPLTDEVSEEFDEDDMKILSYFQQVQDILVKSLINCRVYFVSSGNQKCYAVVEAHSSYPLQEQCEETVHIISSFPQFLLYIGISRHYEAPLQMWSAAMEADQAAQFARYTPETSVVVIDQLPSIPTQVMERIYSDVRFLKSAIENQNIEIANDILKKLFTYIRLNKLPIETVRNICLYVHQFCISLLVSPGTGDYIKKGPIPSLKWLIECESVDGLEANMLSFVAQALDHSEDDMQVIDELVQKVKDYIEKNYSENLSLDYLAGKVHLSPSYLSRLFKREVGENLSSYIQNVRIEEAKILLKTAELKTYEVGERVGISDPVYFSRIFKKITGVKPKDYRQEG